MRDRIVIAGTLAVQSVCAGFFISDILSSLIGWRSTPISWQAREIIEIGAAVGLALGFILGGVALFRSRGRQMAAEAKLRVAATAFSEVLIEYFDDWALTPAERDVALFLIKGMTTAEIAGLRDTSQGTVKAQTNAIYRKAGVTGRGQLLSQFVDGLLDERVFESHRGTAALPVGALAETPVAGDTLGRE